MIKAEGLTKQYGPLTAVDEISFKVEPGEVLGFLGPNGAGKSTTMRMFAGFVPPTAGTAEICGHSIIDDAIRAKSKLGYLPEGAPSYGEMAPREFLDFVAAVRGLRGTEKQACVDQAIERPSQGELNVSNITPNCSPVCDNVGAHHRHFRHRQSCKLLLVCILLLSLSRL